MSTSLQVASNPAVLHSNFALKFLHMNSNHSTPIKTSLAAFWLSQTPKHTETGDRRPPRLRTPRTVGSRGSRGSAKNGVPLSRWALGPPDAESGPQDLAPADGRVRLCGFGFGRRRWTVTAAVSCGAFFLGGGGWGMVSIGNQWTSAAN